MRNFHLLCCRSIFNLKKKTNSHKLCSYLEKWIAVAWLYICESLNHDCKVLAAVYRIQLISFFILFLKLTFIKYFIYKTVCFFSLSLWQREYTYTRNERRTLKVCVLGGGGSNYQKVEGGARTSTWERGTQLYLNSIP